MSNTSKKRLLIIFGVSVIITLIILAIVQNKELKRYQHYVSEEISNSVVQLSSAILSNHEILEETVSASETGNITSENASLLCSNMHTIGMQWQTLSNAGSKLRDMDLSGINDISIFALDVEDYISREIMQNKLLYDCSLPSKGSLTLNEEQLDYLQRLHSVSVEWNRIVNEHIPEATSQGASVEFWNAYLSSIADSSVWTDLLKSLHNSSYDLPLMP